MIVSDKLSISLDKEHGGLRLTVIMSFIASWLILFIILSAFIENQGFSLLAIILGFAGAYGITALLERYLKGRWTSGRVIEVDAAGVRMKRKQTLEGEILSEDPADALLWSFTIKKRARVPKGYSMLACALHFEDTYLSVYTFMSPKQIETLESAEHFTKLVNSKQVSSEREDLRLAGEQRRLRDAENHRWSRGGEMTSDDFMIFFARLKAQYPEWLNSKSS